MRKLLSWGSKLALLVMLVATTVLTACSDNDAPEVSSATINVSTTLPAAYAGLAPVQGTLTVRNINTGVQTTHTIAIPGTLNLANLPVDMYDITLVCKVAPEAFMNATDATNVEDSVTFSASATGVQLKPNDPLPIALELSTPATYSTSGFVFKTLYFAGSNRTTAAGTLDQFIEVYNNTNHVLYADSLCIAITTMNRYGNGHRTQDARYYYTADGRYDWSKAQNMVDTAGANDNYYYANMIFMVPGTGKEHPIQPGESFVIASFANNYKAVFKDSRGREVTPTAPELTVDLSTADWEGVFKNTEAVSNANVPNLTVIHQGNNSYMRLSSIGKEAYVLFRHPDVASFPVYLYPAIDPARGSNSQFMQFPNANLIDVVDVISPTADGYLAPKAILPKDDAGYTYVKSGEYSSMSLTRKVSRLDGNRRVLQDLNNSTLDFVEMKAEPKAFAPQN